MTTRPTTYNVDDVAGTFTVKVQRAEERQVQQWGKRDEIEVLPELRITGQTKVRGITYDVDVTYHWLRHSRPIYDDGRETGKHTHWEADRRSWHDSTADYRRADKGTRPGWSTPTRTALDVVVERVLDQVATTHPEWQDTSRVLRAERRVARAQEQADELHRKWQDATAHLAAMQAELVESEKAPR